MASASYATRLKSDFTTMAWVLIPIAVGMNLVGRFVVQTLRLPFFLDVTGTFLLAILAGPWVAAVGGILTAVMIAVTINPATLPFAITQATLGIVAGLLAMRGWFAIQETVDYWKLLGAAVILGFISALVSTPIAVYVFGGITGAPADVATGIVLAAGRDLFEAVFAGRIVFELIDKLVAVVVAYLIVIKLPDRYLPERAEKALNR